MRLKVPALKCSDTVDSSAARKRLNKVGAKIHPCFHPLLSCRAQWLGVEHRILHYENPGSNPVLRC